MLFSCLPGFGHFNPMMPLAQAASEAGHEVAFATAERFCRRVIEPAGVAAFGAGLSPPDVEARTRRLPEMASIDDNDVWAFGAHMFARVAAAGKVADLASIIDEWRPQLVVHDAIDFAAPLAARRAGLRSVAHSFGALQPDSFWALAGELVSPLWHEWNVAPGPFGSVFDYLYLDICPPSFQADNASGIPVLRPLRPVPYDLSGAAELPSWVGALPPRPTVYVTMGTIFNDTPGVFEAFATALADSDVNVVITVGLDRDPAELGSLPANVHVERWIPQSLLFARCHAVVCHGGSGTTLAALGHGLPLLLLPQGANQFWNAERCVALGAGLSVDLDHLDAATIRQAVHRLLATPSFGRTARGIAEEIRQMPAPPDVVPLLEAEAREAAGG
ncbi:MAG TPA: glycosyltransferase [Acidimicrobiales bacterium]|nr:glycosyltransferase [Acidimicrobiales bacterium]